MLVSLRGGIFMTRICERTSFTHISACDALVSSSQTTVLSLVKMADLHIFY